MFSLTAYRFAGVSPNYHKSYVLVVVNNALLLFLLQMSEVNLSVSASYRTNITQVSREILQPRVGTPLFEHGREVLW